LVGENSLNCIWQLIAAVYRGLASLMLAQSLCMYILMDIAFGNVGYSPHP